MADDLLVGIGIDVAAFRRDRAIILAETQGLQRDIVNALEGTQVLPDLGAQARIAGQSVITGLREAIQGGAGALRRDVADALIPQALATDVARLRNTVRSGIAGISNDFAAEGAESAAAFLSQLDRGLADAGAVFAGFARQVNASLSGSRGILGDLTPQAEEGGRQLVAGLERAIQRDAGALRTSIRAALVPTDLSASFGPLLKGVQDVTTTIVATLGAGGREGGRALTSGLASELVTADAAIGRFAISAAARLENANLLAGLASQGEREGQRLVTGVVTAIIANAGEIERAVAGALVPASLPTELRAITSAVATETARLVPLLTSTGTEAGRGLIGALSRELTQGATTAVTLFARGAGTAVAGTNLLGDLTPAGDKAGTQLSTGVQRALSRESVALRTSITAAIVPTDIGSSLTRLEGTLTSELARFPALFTAAGTEAGGALVAGITAQLTSGRQLLAGFATETSSALTAALTIGDTTGAGERAGRLLAGAVATGIAGEAPRVQAALAAALLPSAVLPEIQRITSGVTAEIATLAPQFAREGTKDGQAYIAAIEGVVSEGASALKQLTAGATVGVVVDVAPIRAATDAQQAFTAAVESSVAATQKLWRASGLIDTTGMSDAEEVATMLAEAEQRAAASTKSAAGAFIDSWRAQQQAAAGVAEQVKTTSVVVFQAAQQETDAIASGADAIRAHINLLKLYAQSVDTTNAQAVAGWTETAAIVRENARSVGIEGEELFKLDGFIRRTSESFRVQAAEARNAARAIAEQGAPTTGGGATLAAELAAVTGQANKAKKAVAGVAIAGRSMQQISNRLGPALIGIGFGLESLARGGTAAEGGLRTALRAVASFAVFFGPEGFIVAGVAAATAGILDLFNATRDEIKKTEEQFRTSVNAMIKSGDVKGLRAQFKEIEEGLPDITKGGKLTGGVVELSQELEKATQNARGLKALLLAADVPIGEKLGIAVAFAQATLNARGLNQQLITAQDHSAEIAKLFQAPTKEVQAGLEKEKADAAKKAAEEAAAALRKQADQIGIVQEALKRSNDNATLHTNIIRSAIPLYDSIRKQAEAHKNDVSDTANDLAKMLKTLGDIDAVSIELTRRKLGGIVPTATPRINVVGIIDKIELPKAPETLTVPVGLDAKVFNDSLKTITDQLAGAQTQDIFAKIFGNKQQVAEASKGLDIALGNTKQALEAGIAAELASNDAISEKLRIIREYIALGNELNIDLTKNTKATHDFVSALSDIGNAVTAIARVGDEIGGVNRDILDAIDAAGRFAEALSAVADIKFTGTDSLFSSFTNLLKSIPVIGDAISSAVNLGKTAFNAITGRDTKRENDRILVENTDALEKLRQDLQGFDDSITLLRESRAIDTSSILNARAGTSGFGRGLKSVEDLDRELRASGTSLSELKRRAAEFGITITDAKGRISALGLTELNEAIQITIRELTTFKDTLGDQSFLADARRAIFDDTSATAVANDWLKQLQQFAPDLFGKVFAGADTATKEGRARLKKGIQEAFELVSKNLIPPEVLLQFGGAKGFVEFLLAGNDALKEFADTANQATGEMVNVVKGFKDFNLERARFAATSNDQLIRNITSIPAPAPTPIPVGTTTGMMSVGQVTFAPTIRIDGRDKDAVEITTEVVTELRRRAKASANPDVRKTVNLLPS